MPIPSAAAVSASGLASGIKWDADGGGVGAVVDMKKGSSYEYNEETTTETVGPFFGEGEDEVPSGDKYSIKVSGNVPELGDTGQDAPMAARKSKVRGTLTVYTLKGKQVVLTDCLITKLTIKSEAKGGQSIELEGVAKDGTITNAATS